MNTPIPPCSENGRHSVIKDHKSNTNQSPVGMQGQGPSVCWAEQEGLRSGKEQGAVWTRTTVKKMVGDGVAEAGSADRPVTCGRPWTLFSRQQKVYSWWIDGSDKFQESQMWANLAVLLELSNYREPSRLWTLVGLFHASSNIPYAMDWAFLYKRDTIPSFTDQATGQSSGSGGQLAIVTAIISIPPQSGVCLPQGSPSYQVPTTYPLGPFLWPLLSTLSMPCISFPLPSNSLSPLTCRVLPLAWSFPHFADEEMKPLWC